MLPSLVSMLTSHLRRLHPLRRLIRPHQQPHMLSSSFTTTPPPLPTATACPNCNSIPINKPCYFICPSCDTLKDIPADCSHFQVLGLPLNFRTSLKDIDSAYKQLQKRLHPDLHHQSPSSSELAASHSARVNAACDVLNNPVLRAQHYMSLSYGIDPLAEGAPSLNDPELLMFVMEARQEIEDVESNDAEVLHSKHQAMMGEIVEELSLAFENSEVETMEKIKILIKMQYVSKMVEEIHSRTPVL